MRKNAIILTAILFAFALQANAQNKLSIDNVYKISLRSAGPIIQKEQTKGYYFFYQSDKIDKKTNEYTLQILDENLNKLKDVKFQDSKNVSLLESSYNGDAITFMFYNDETKSIDYRLHHMDGKPSFTYSKALDSRSRAHFLQMLKMMDDEESENQNLFDIPGKGFVGVTPLRENKRYTYDVNFYSSEKRRNWTFDPIEVGKFQSAEYLGANDSIVLIEVLSKQKLMSNDLESSLVGLTVNNGKKAFEVGTIDKGKQFYPLSVSTLEGMNEFLVIGLYYAQDGRVMADRSEGLGIWLMNNQGKLIRSKYLSWKDDLGKFLNVDQKGRVEDLGYLYIHRIMQTEDGKIYAIGEGYKKVASGVGIAASILSRGTSGSNTQLKITELLMLELTKDFGLTNAKIYDKRNNTFAIQGGDFVSPHILARLAKSYGYFDYAYSQMTPDHSGFVTTYTDYEKSKGYKGSVLNSISMDEGKVSTDKLNLKSEASRMVMLPAKTGSVLLVEYFKKDKRLDLRLEKLN